MKKQVKRGCFMKKNKKSIGFIILFIAIMMIFSVVACDNGVGSSSGSGGGGGGTPTAPTSITYTGIIDEQTYSLKLTDSDANRAVYLPKTNDDYILTKGNQSNSGKVVSIIGTFTLKPSDSDLTFTVTIVDGNISTITGIILWSGYQNPITSDFNISNLTQIAGNISNVTITSKEGKSTGAIKIYYDGLEVMPASLGTYTVTFDVAESIGWNAVNGLAGGTLTISAANQNPATSDFNIGNLTQTTGSVTPVTITPKAGKSTGAITIYYNGSTTLPSAAGTYTVTFNVAESTGWNAIIGLPGGYLTILQPVHGSRFEYYWVDAHGSLVTTSGGNTNVAPGEILTITAQSTGYIVKQWHLNGINTGQSGNTFNFSSTTSGKHTVGLFVEKDGRLYNTNINITVSLPIPVSRSIKINMYDAYGDGWNASGALRIVVNGNQIANNVTVTQFTNAYTFSVNVGDVVQVYWVVGTGTSYQYENSFIIYYENSPPSPQFYTGSLNSQNNVGPTSWSGTGSLLHRLRTTTSSGTVSGTLQGTTNGTLLGSFTVQ